MGVPSPINCKTNLLLQLAATVTAQTHQTPETFPLLIDAVSNCCIQHLHHLSQMFTKRIAAMDLHCRFLLENKLTIFQVRLSQSFYPSKIILTALKPHNAHT